MFVEIVPLTARSVAGVLLIALRLSLDFHIDLDFHLIPAGPRQSQPQCPSSSDRANAEQPRSPKK
jgi:hypothetical protein